MGLPLLGILAAGHPLERYLEFPPRTVYLHPAPYSGGAFFIYSLIFSGLFLPLVRMAGRSFSGSRKRTPARSGFPWWGRASLVLGGLSWAVAWTRIPVFASVQPHTFFPLWLAYILVINALCRRRDGTCMMTRRPVVFCCLFPVSALFWWYFEYLNRFVQNWHYLGVEYGAVTYAVLATLSFSTVLPAVLGTREWLAGVRWIREGFVFKKAFPADPKPYAVLLLLLSGSGLFGIGIWPNLLFPLLWTAPLLMLFSLQILTETEGVLLCAYRKGDLRPAVSAGLAALICGGFWEMWNFYSLAKWVYRIPYVHRFEIFEMPVLGYAGYLPFGLECAVVGELLDRLFRNGTRRMPEEMS